MKSAQPTLRRLLIAKSNAATASSSTQKSQHQEKESKKEPRIGVDISSPVGNNSNHVHDAPSSGCAHQLTASAVLKAAAQSRCPSTVAHFGTSPNSPPAQMAQSRYSMSSFRNQSAMSSANHQYPSSGFSFGSSNSSSRRSGSSLCNDRNGVISNGHKDVKCFNSTSFWKKLDERMDRKKKGKCRSRRRLPFALQAGEQAACPTSAQPDLKSSMQHRTPDPMDLMNSSVDEHQERPQSANSMSAPDSPLSIMSPGNSLKNTLFTEEMQIFGLHNNNEGCPPSNINSS